MYGNNGSNSTVTDAFSNEYPLGYPALHGFLIPVTIIGFVFNASVIIGILTDLKMRKIENILHFNLACVDIFLLMLSSLPLAIHNLTYTFVRDILKTIHCSLFVFACVTNIVALVEIAVFRMKRFTQYDAKISKQKMICAVIVAWSAGAFNAAIYTFSPLQLPDHALCGQCLQTVKVLPVVFVKGIQVIVLAGGAVLLIGTFGKCVWHLLKLKHIHPTTEAVQPERQSVRREGQFTDITRVFAIELDSFQHHGNGTVDDRERGEAQPSPHFLDRRHLVVTTLILLLCAMMFLIGPIAINNMLWALGTSNRFGFAIVYFLIACNSTVTPIVYFMRFQHFRRVICGWMRKCRTRCRGLRE